MKEITIIMGYIASGKSTLVQDFVKLGHFRLNRDDEGGSLSDLNRKLEATIKSNVANNFVLDNTYGTKEQRAEVIKIAKRYGYRINCVWIDASIEDAQFNSSWRILSATGNKDPNSSLGPDGHKKFKNIPGIVPVISLFAYKKAFETPSFLEGFDSIKKIKFERRASGFNNKAVIFDYDGTLRQCTGKEKYPCDPSEVKIFPNRKEIIAKWKNNGYLLLGVSNQSGIEKGKLSEEVAKACFDKTNQLLGFDIDYQYCPHHSFPIRCYCRKPLSGLGVSFIMKYKLNERECIFVGDQKTDETFATRCGFQFEWAKDFFK